MSQTDAVFAGSIPAFYDRYLGPLLFEPYARDLAGRLANIAQGRVLETAAGTGILVRTLPEAVAIVATDLNQPMIDFAAAQPGGGRVTWRQADALALPFEEKSFDAVACQFGVMFFPDKRAAYREARRVLKPGGRFVFSVWDRLAENELSQIVSETVAALFSEDQPRFLGSNPLCILQYRDDPQRTGRGRIFFRCWGNSSAIQPCPIRTRGGHWLVRRLASAQ